MMKDTFTILESGSSLAGVVGDTILIGTKVETDGIASKDVAYYSEDETIAFVNRHGEISCFQAGSTDIYAIVIDGNIPSIAAMKAALGIDLYTEISYENLVRLYVDDNELISSLTEGIDYWTVSVTVSDVVSA